VEEPTAEVVMDDAGEDVVLMIINHKTLLNPRQPRLLTQHGSSNLQGLLLLIRSRASVKLYLVNLNSLGPAYDLLKGTCASSIELEYNFQECFNALTTKHDWNNPEGDRYPFDLSKPLPLQGHPGHLTVSVDYFFNNDMEYLKSSDPEITYTTSIMKTKAARRFLVRRVLVLRNYIGYGHLEEVVVKRDDQRLCKFKEGDFVDLHLNDIEDMLLLCWD
ncbi:hypothetical protein Tco_1267658, partial [Tanacetum coccineum]